MSAPPVQPLYSPSAAPPIKKQRAGSTPDRLTASAEDAIARRRAQLQALQQKRNQSTPLATVTAAQRGATPSTEDLLARARSQLLPSGAPPVPQQSSMHAQPRSSDIFPGVAKMMSSQPAPAGPPPPAQGQTPVNRRLSPSFQTPAAELEQARMRSKSAPPSRPPPPADQRSTSVEAPEAKRPPPPRGAPPSTKKAPPKGPPPQAQSKNERVGPPGGSPASPPKPKAPPPRPKTAPPPLKEETLSPVPQKTSSPAPTKTPDLANIDSTAGRTPFVTHHVETPEIETPSEVSPPPVSSPPLQTPSLQSPYFTSTVGHTPFVGMPASLTPNSIPSSVLHDRIQMIRDSSATPAKPETLQDESMELRLTKELAHVHQEKKKALEKATELEDTLSHVAEHDSSSINQLHTILQLAQTQGEASALDWVRRKVEDQGGDVPDLLTGTKLVPPSPRRPADPRPKNEASLDPVFVRQAVEQTPFEYETDLATYTVRRPCGLASERELWFAAGQLNAKLYERQADVSKASSLEVVAKIHADGSLLAVHGEGITRHQSTKGDWDELGNVYERGSPLRSFMFRQGDEIEQSYALDDVFEGAIAVRLHYCASVISLASGLKRNPPVPSTSPSPATSKQVETTDAGVDTKDLAFPKESQKEAAGSSEEVGSDALSLFFGVLSSFLLSFIYNMVMFPVRVVYAAFVLFSATILVSFLFTYLADDSATGVGASLDLMFNRPGIV